MKGNVTYSYEQPNEGNPEEIKEFLVKHWGSALIVSRGKSTDATKISRVVARDDKGKLVGLTTYAVDKEGGSCEGITIDSILERQGVGSKLIRLMEGAAKKKGCKRVWFITTNDNLEAAAFYIKRGYRLVAVHLNVMEESRRLKPQIPKVGKHEIPLLDEWEFEKLLE